MGVDHDSLSADQLHLLAALASNVSAVATAEQLECDLATLSERLVVIRSALDVDSTADAVRVTRARGLI